MSASNWRDFAACATGYEPDLFFPVGTTGAAAAQAEEAKAVCRRCPVRDACLRYALEHRVDDGVCGGLTENERRGIHGRKNTRGRTTAA